MAKVMQFVHLVCVCVCVYVCVHVHAGVMYNMCWSYTCAPLVWLHVHVCLMQCTCMCNVPDEDSHEKDCPLDRRIVL